MSNLDFLEKAPWRKAEWEEVGDVPLDGDVHVSIGPYDNANDVLEILKGLIDWTGKGPIDAELVESLTWALPHFHSITIHVGKRRQRSATIRVYMDAEHDGRMYVIDDVFCPPEVKEMCEVAGQVCTTGKAVYS